MAKKWHLQMSREQFDEMANLTEELRNISIASGADASITWDDQWNALKHMRDGKPNVRFNLSFVCLTEQEARDIIAAGAAAATAEYERRQALMAAKAGC